MMLVSEAARSAGVFNGADILGRPACAMIAHAVLERLEVILSANAQLETYHRERNQ